MGKVFTITQGLENMGALRNGGQGSVYKARRIGEIIVAVKLLPTPIHTESEDDKNFKNFRNEVEKLKKVNENPTPHVVKIFSSGITESGSLPFIEMEFIEGPDLGELLNAPHDPVFTIHEVIKVADQLASALSHCHKVGVKHGDVKSNNVKYNIHTGNYVLLDFGLAIMTDEQRRDSLRNAGAVEFMAPEQNEGIMLPQSDVYSYGIILYELLAGAVPFPLTANAQTARNNIMIAHLEAPVPDLLELRQANLPNTWDDQKKAWEMQVPEWLLQIINRCLQKQPADRFADGTELHQAILTQNSALAAKSNTEEALLLQAENESLQKLLTQECEKAALYEQEITKAKQTLAQSNNELMTLRSARPATPNPVAQPTVTASKSKGISVAAALWIGLIVACLGAYAGHLLFPTTANAKQETPVSQTLAVEKNTEPVKKTSKPKAKKKAAVVKEDTATESEVKNEVTDTVAKEEEAKTQPKKTIQPPANDPKGKDAGKTFTLFASYAYFHDRPDASSVRKANINRWNNARLTAIDDINGYIYVVYKNEQGQVSKGWLNKKDLIKVN
ncbi:serine/threonine-protein kinase [Mucilaginibacter sp. PAMB04168]|uniref:serine/threonine protein kinase n=1 Tax=Mucilaginibacter sp. PAMB04168 TaxID=3138567 RepID=UPI0031F7098B